MKPVELVVRALSNSTERGALVADPFAGSGTTLVAAQMTGREARLIELDPKYCDVIVSRYQDLTGDPPILERTGDAWDFTAQPPCVTPYPGAR
jgi:DNA modification methylase